MYLEKANYESLSEAFPDWYDQVIQREKIEKKEILEMLENLKQNMGYASSPIVGNFQNPIDLGSHIINNNRNEQSPNYFFAVDANQNGNVKHLEDVSPITPINVNELRSPK